MKDAVPGTHFQFSLNDISPIISDIVCELWDCEGGGRFSFPIAFIRACISVAVDVVGIIVGAGAVGEGGWFCRRVVIRSICFFAWS